jgi:PAS domain S-box-containing protein
MSRADQVANEISYAFPPIGSITARLLTPILGGYLVVALIVACVQFVAEYRHEKERVLHDIEAMQQRLGPVVADALSHRNDGTLSDVLLGVAQLPAVIGGRVDDAAGGTVRAVGVERPAGSLDASFSRSLPIVRADENGPRAIGSWTILTSRQAIARQVEFGFFSILVHAAVMALALGLIAWSVVRRRLAAMVRGLKASAMESEARHDRLLRQETERRRAEDEASAGRQRLLQSIVDQSPAAIHVKDLKGRYLLVNRRFEELYRVTAADIVGKTDSAVFPGDDAARLRALDEDVLAAGSALEEETMSFDGDDACTVLSIKFPLADGHGRACAVCGIATDITERKRAEDALRRSEEEYRSTVEDALEGIFRVSLQGQMLTANPAFAHMLGYDWVDDLLDGITDVRRQLYVHPNERDVIMSTLLEQGAVEGQEVELRRKDGGTLWVSISTRLVRDDAGAALFIETFASDISERKRVEAELRMHQDHLEELVTERTSELTHAKEQADVANQAKSTFLASMSHELRTPLNAVLGFAQILQMDARLTSRQRLSLETIQHSGEQLLALINDILDLAKIEAGKMDLVGAPVLLHEFIRIIADIIRVKADEKKLHFRCDTPPDLPVGVHADERRLRQVLLNLLSNAVKFTDSGEVRLQVSMPVSRGGDAVLRFEVEDTGVGIEPEHAEKIFLPFEQVGNATRRAGGTGLGLAISRQLVRAMGGDIRVESHAGRGSRFWFELQLPVVEARLASGAARVEIVGYEGPRRRVLVVDDVPANRGVLVDLLGSLGFAVEEAADGQELLTRARATRPDLVIADIVMPRLDGVQATQEMRRTPSLEAVPVLLVSATIGGSDIDRYLAAGASAFLPKPIDVRQLLQRIGELLKLNWTLSHTPQTPDSTAPLIPPPQPTLQALARLAQRGEMRGLREAALQLGTLGDQYKPFANRLHYLAEHFESRAITQLIQPFLEP